MHKNVVTIDMNRQCVECGKPGAMPSGMCLTCGAKALQGKKMRTLHGQLLQNRVRQLLKEKDHE